jgi:hypothetical protein
LCAGWDSEDGVAPRLPESTKSRHDYRAGRRNAPSNQRAGGSLLGEHGAGRSLEQTDRFDVIVLGFEPRAESPETRLQRAFGIDAKSAEQLVDGLPSTVQRAVSLVRAEYFRRALALLGARVEVREPDGRLVTAPQAEAPVQDAGNGSEPWRAPEPHAGQARRSDPPPAQIGSTNRTLATAAPAMTMSNAGAVAAPLPDDGRGLVRGPAEPTLREVPAPVFGADLRSAASTVSERPGPLQPSSAPRAAATSADPLWPRVPSSVWDPPPSQPRAPERAPAHVTKAATPEVPPRSTALERAAAQFDLTKSVAMSPLWRPPPTSDPAGLLPLNAITLEEVPPEPPPRVLAPWEQPSAESMAEPKKKPVSTRPRPGAAVSGRAPVSARSPVSGQAPVSARAPLSGQAPVSARAPQARPNRAAAAVPLAGPERKPVPVAPIAPSSAKPRTKVDLRSFWESFGEALRIPFSGPGWYWIAAITGWAVLVGMLDQLSGFGIIVGWVLVFTAHTSLLAFACDYYKLCFWTPAAGDDVLDRAPSFGATGLFTRYVRSGVHLSLFILASQAALISWMYESAGSHPSVLDTWSDPMTWLLALLPICYWPMGVGIAALNNNFAAIWNVSVGLRAIARAPLEYASIAAVGALTLLGTWLGLIAIDWFFDVTGAVVVCAIGFPLAISHGIQGALMGHLVRARPEVFE